jgi:hypothetical protein
MKNSILIGSIVLNVLCIVYIIMQMDEHKGGPTYDPKELLIDSIDYKISSNKNFHSVFILKNDSLYRRLWNKTFQEQPEDAFFLSAAYYYITNDSMVKDDIDMSLNQLETIYHNKINALHPQLLISKE